jgi:hypothetical protein
MPSSAHRWAELACGYTVASWVCVASAALIASAPIGTGLGSLAR